MTELRLDSLRARKARLSQWLNKEAAKYTLAVSILLCAAIGIYSLSGPRIVFVPFALLLVVIMFVLWWLLDLSQLPTQREGELNDRLNRDVLMRLHASDELTPKLLWQRLEGHWQYWFVCNHLLLHPNIVVDALSDNATDLMFVWEKAAELADSTDCAAIEAGHLTAALILTSSALAPQLTAMKLTSDDVLSINKWLGIDLASMNAPRPTFGGIGRDWANGFTPTLNHFGQNISLGIEKHGAHFGSLIDSPGVTAIKSAFSQGSTAIALVGEDGIGKTTYAHALAQSILAENKDRSLEHNQVFALNPSPIISAARGPGDLEHIVNTLLAEASRAGHIILFLDDAQLFFQNGPGSFDATQILLPVLQSRAVRVIVAMTPHDFQLLKGSNPAFAGLLTPVILQEPDQQSTMESLMNAATNMELRHKQLISLSAVKEAFRLSGRYEQDMAYPGKAIMLLEQSLTHADNNVITDRSVQSAIEQTKGVKAASTTPAEADQLLHLEDDIHQRMINQSRAVSVVSNALRRARAGVANPNRPIGSFLFLGPTGVGKTELSKAIAATYFGNEASMIRLDMSEYQQDNDVSRLLSSGEGEASSLIIKVRQQPFSVVLLDEIEKANPNVLNLLLQMLDEGKLTDNSGRAVSFKDCIIICTSNAGADAIRQRIEQGEQLETFEQEFTDQLINSGQFKPELLNRFDEIVLFRPLNADELKQVVSLMLAEVNRTLAQQQVSVELTDAAIGHIVATGNDPRMGARPMRRALQRSVEDTVAKKILSGEAKPGDHITLDIADINQPEQTS
jgi:ATP-dependent Clp protease ATP-binding subunit ClpC